MKSILVSILLTMLSASLLCAQHLANGKSSPVCQGEYSFVSKDAKGNRKVVKADRWHMDSIGDGSYSVTVEVLFPIGANAEERRVLTKELKPKSYVLSVSTKAGDNDTIIRIECDYGTTELSCRTTDNGSSLSEKLQVKPPYLFLPIEDIAPQDFAWGFQSVASQAERVMIKARRFSSEFGSCRNLALTLKFRVLSIRCTSARSEDE
jgi:hypothetical protein